MRCTYYVVDKMGSKLSEILNSISSKAQAPTLTIRDTLVPTI